MDLESNKILKTFIKDFWVLLTLAIMLVFIAGLLVYNNFISTNRYQVQWFNLYKDDIIPSENIKCETISYDADLISINVDTITLDDGITPDLNALSIKALANEEIIVDKENQSSFYTWGNSQFGTIIKNGQLYGLISYNGTEMQSGYLIKDTDEEFLNKYTLDLSFKGIVTASYLKTIKTNDKTYDIVYLYANGCDNYLYIDRKTKRCDQYFEIVDKTVTYHKFSDYDGDIVFFENMETFPMYITKAEEFDEIYSQFVTASALLANNNITINLNELMKKYEIEE